MNIFFLEISNRSYGVSKNRECYADFKNATCLSDIIPLKKVKIKKQKWDLAKLENSFLILTFLAGILPLRQVWILEIIIKFSIANLKNHWTLIFTCGVKGWCECVYILANTWIHLYCALD